MADDVTRQNQTPKKRPPRWEKAFLSSLSSLGNVRLACEAAEVGRAVAYERRKVEPDFAAAWDAALEEAADLLEEEARRRAYEGLRRVKFDRGKPIMVPVVGADGLVVKDDKGNPELVPYVEHEYSDTLLIFLVKAARPQKYRETIRTVTLNISPDDLKTMSDDDLDRLEAELRTTNRY